MSRPWINARVTYQETWERTVEVSLDEETVRDFVGHGERFIGPLSPEQITEYLHETYDDGETLWTKATGPDPFVDEFITLDVERVVMQP